MKRLVGLVLAVVGLLWALPAEAAPRSGVDKVEVVGPAGCIDGMAFKGHLSALPASTLNVEAPRAASVRIVKHDAVFTGELMVILADGTTTVRQVASTQCSEVTDALELVAALAFGLESAPVVAKFVPPPPAMVLPPPVVLAPPSQTPVSTRISLVRPRKESAPSKWRFIATADVELLLGVGPSVEVAPSIALGAVLDVPGLVAPEIDLRGTWSTSGAVPDSSNKDITATLTLAQGAVSGCPIRITLGAGLALRPCLELQAGAYTSSASVELAGSSQPWLALMPLAQAEWHIGRFFILNVGGGPTVPFFHDRFYFQPIAGASRPQTSFYPVPDVGAAFRLGVAVQLP